MKEIERKFLVNELPELAGKEKVNYERYYIFAENGIDLRVQRKGVKFQLERKEKVSDVEFKKETLDISDAEFNLLKTLATHEIIRDSYQISEDPDVTIKIYHGKHEGLVRAEVEFASAEDAQAFQSPDWFGREITETPLGRDGELIKLSDEEFKTLLV